MSPTRKLMLLALAAWALQAAAATAQLPSAPLAKGEIVVTEFFEDLYRVNPATGGKAHLNPGAFDPIEMIEIDSERNLIAIDADDRLVRFNPVTLTVAPISTSQLFPGAVDLAIEPSGSILVVSESDVFRVNPVTGNAATLVNHLNVNGGFFGPNGIAVGPTGRIFVTEFFESAWEINPMTGAAAKLPLSRELSHANNIKVRSDGDLIIRESNSSLLRVSPGSGAVSYFWYGLPGFPKDFAMEADNDVILTSTLGLFRYDASTGQQSPLTIIPGGEFFSPGAIAIAPGSAPVSMEADFDGDFDVDHDDLLAWRGGFGRTSGAVKTHGNASADGDVDGDDFLLWQRQLGANSTAAAPVPEPGALTICGAALVAGAARRRQSAARRTQTSSLSLRANTHR